MDYQQLSADELKQSAKNMVKNMELRHLEFTTNVALYTGMGDDAKAAECQREADKLVRGIASAREFLKVYLT